MYIPSHLKLLVVDGAIARVDFNTYLGNVYLNCPRKVILELLNMKSNEAKSIEVIWEFYVITFR